jgi:hypothetical protein
MGLHDESRCGVQHSVYEHQGGTSSYWAEGEGNASISVVDTQDPTGARVLAPRFVLIFFCSEQESSPRSRHRGLYRMARWIFAGKAAAPDLLLFSWLCGYNYGATITPQLDCHGEPFGLGSFRADTLCWTRAFT